jgi:hypothetical protein
MNAAYQAFQYASDNANKAAAEVARLELLRLAGEIPGMTGMTFETEYEYDDEGGYFRTLSCYPTFASDSEADFDQYDFIDAMNGFGAEPICVLCDVHTDSAEGEITIEQARERRF